MFPSKGQARCPRCGGLLGCVVGGAVGLGFALHEPNDNWTDPIENNHETEASRSMTHTDDDIQKMCSTVRKQFDDRRTALEEMDRKQREEEVMARRQQEEEEKARRRIEEEKKKARRQREEEVMARRQQEEEEKARRRMEEEKKKARRQREEEVMARRQQEEEEKARRRMEEEKKKARRQREEEVMARRQQEEEEKARRRMEEEKKKARRQREEEVMARRQQEEEEKARRRMEEEKKKARRQREEEVMARRQQEEEEKARRRMEEEKKKKARRQREEENRRQRDQSEHTGGDQGDEERDDEDKERDQGDDESDSEEETEEEESDSEEETEEGTIRFALLNTRSMNNRTSRIVELITQNDLDVFLTTETWLQHNTAETVLREASPEDFSFHSQQREGRGGGVAIQFSEELQGEQLHFDFLNITTFEFVVTVVQHDEWNQPVVTINLYHPPGYNQERFRKFLDEFQSLLDEVKKKYSSIIVTGDFNIHVNNERRSYTDEFEYLLWVNDLEQHIEEPTHRGGNTLDLVITTNVEVSGLNVRNDGISDHYTVYFNAKPKDTKNETEENKNDEQTKRVRKPEE